MTEMTEITETLKPCQQINNILGKKIYKINMARLHDLFKIIAGATDENIEYYVGLIRRELSIQININRYQLQLTALSREILQKKDIIFNSSELNIFRNVFDIEYEFDMNELIDDNNFYLVSSLRALPDTFIDEGIHSFSLKYLFENTPQNHTLVTRFSIHLYTNDKVYPHGRGSWEMYNYLIIINLKDIKEHLYSIEWEDTVIIQGIDYKNKEIYVVLPENETEIISRLQKWLSKENIYSYKPCPMDHFINLKSDDILYSTNKLECKTSRDMTDDVLNIIFKKLQKKILKKEQSGLLKFLLYNPYTNSNICYVNKLNYTNLNNSSGDGNKFEDENMISMLKTLTNNTIFAYDDTYDDTNGETLCIKDFENIVLLHILFYLLDMINTKNYNNIYRIINDTSILYIKINRIINELCFYFNITKQFAIDLMTLMKYLLINDTYEYTVDKLYIQSYANVVINSYNQKQGTQEVTQEDTQEDTQQDKQFSFELYSEFFNIQNKIRDLNNLILLNVNMRKFNILNIIFKFQYLLILYLNYNNNNSLDISDYQEIFNNIIFIFNSYTFNEETEEPINKKYLKYKVKYLKLKNFN